MGRDGWRVRVSDASEGRWKTNRGVDRARDARWDSRTRGRARPPRARDGAPRSTFGDRKTSPRKKDGIGGDKRAGEGTHQATGTGAPRTAFLRMNLSCREVRVPWVRPADARLIASILVNARHPPCNSQKMPLVSQVSHCFPPLGCGRESFRATRRRRAGWISMNSRRNPRFHRRPTPCARTNRGWGARGSRFGAWLGWWISQS